MTKETDGNLVKYSSSGCSVKYWENKMRLLHGIA
jgi:hypothetical protein